MDLNLIFKQNRTWSLIQLKNKSIALNGAVDVPFLNHEDQIYSFTQSLNYPTEATCVQVLNALLLGLNPNGFIIYINNLDADTFLSLILLEAATVMLKYSNTERPKRLRLGPVTDLVRAIGLVSVHGVNYPLEKNIQDIVNSFFIATGLRLKNFPGYMEEQILVNSDPISAYEEVKKKYYDWSGEIHIEEIKADVKVTHRGNGFIFATVLNQPIPLSDPCKYEPLLKILYEDGYTAVILWQKQEDKSFTYTIARKSRFIYFPVNVITKKLSQIEHGWLGDRTIGFAPMNADGSRSKIHPDHLFELIETYDNALWKV